MVLVRGTTTEAVAPTQGDMGCAPYVGPRPRIPGGVPRGQFAGTLMVHRQQVTVTGRSYIALGEATPVGDPAGQT